MQTSKLNHETLANAPKYITIDKPYAKDNILIAINTTKI